MTIILDMGSGETCKNDIAQVSNMINAVDTSDPREHEIILKWQLFRGGEFEHLRALHHGVFAYAYDYARSRGYATTASVFDRPSAKFLRGFNIPFVKGACVHESRELAIGLSNSGYWDSPIVLSVDHDNRITHYSRHVTSFTENILCCVREYPATIAQYEDQFTGERLRNGISDHTDHTKGMYLLSTYRPRIYETHFCLDSQTGPDTGPFALRPNQLSNMLEAL